MTDSLARDGSRAAEDWLRAGELIAAGAFSDAQAAYAEAARAGHADAQVELARMLLFGIAAAPEPLQAIAWLTRAEAAGHVGAAMLLVQVAVGKVLLRPDGDANARLLEGVSARHPLALRAAAIAFSRNPHARGRTMATRLLQAGATRGDPVCAQLLAERMAAGIGCEENPAAAAQLWAELDAAGVPRLPRVGIAEDPTPADPRDEEGARALDLAEYLRTPDASPLSTQPAVREVPRLLNADECRLLIALATPLMRPSCTVDPVTGERVAAELRTSQDAHFDVLQEDVALRLVQARMAAAAGLPLDQAEQLIVLRYEPGQEYRPHRDYLPPESIARDRPQAGNRSRTICVYLNDVEAGGHTTFPQANLSIAPRAGDAIVFDNLDERGAPDASTLHAGLPVERGVKWLATLWIRERPYRYF